MIKIDPHFLDGLILKSKQTTRGRIIYRFHQSDDDPLQRMLNAMQPGTYLQPHKHENPDKREVFLALTGKFLVVEFDENGDITDHMILDAKTRFCAAEIPARVFHTIVCLEPDSVVYEFKDGPYHARDDKHFATWAPKEGEDGCEEYLKKLLDQLQIAIDK